MNKPLKPANNNDLFANAVYDAVAAACKKHVESVKGKACKFGFVIDMFGRKCSFKKGGKTCP